MTAPRIKFSKGIQLTVYLDKQTGSLAALAGFLGKHGVNIYGWVLSEAEERGYVRLVVDDTEKARQLIEDAGDLVVPREILLVQVANEPGWLARILQLLAAAGVRLDYGYSMGGPEQEKAMALAVSDVAAAQRALEISLGSPSK